MIWEYALMILRNRWDVAGIFMGIWKIDVENDSFSWVGNCKKMPQKTSFFPLTVIFLSCFKSIDEKNDLAYLMQGRDEGKKSELNLIP